jgi:V/A-type H+-transporting ATPase subunit C
LPVDTEYAYAVARIRAVGKKLLDKSGIDRMVDAKTAEDALKVLIDIDYGYSSGDLISAYEYERLLKEESKKVFTLLRDIAPQPEIFDLFLQSNDYHNLKVILKSEFLGNEDNSNILLDSATIPVNKLKIMVRERKLSEMPGIMRNAVEECIESFNRTGDPQVIDLILDRANYSQMVKNAAEIKNDFLIDLVKIMIDLANIKTFLRVRSMKKSWDFLQKVLLPGGRIERGTFVKMLQDSLDNAVNILKFTPYDKVCEEGIADYQKNGSMSKFEKLADNFITKYVRKALFINLGVEPLIAYLIAKEVEIRNARIIMVGKINGISNEIIRERLREAYV